MRCPKCGVENARTSDVCVGCRAELRHVCPVCGSETPHESEFCDQCGERLPASRAGSKPNAAQGKEHPKIPPDSSGNRQAPASSEPGPIKGERRPVTIMVCLLEHRTAAQPPGDPTRYPLVIDGVKETLVGKVLDYEGAVFEPTTGGITAVFGFPLALEEIPQRAIHAALALREEVSDFNEGVGRDRSTGEILLRIGIHSCAMAVGAHLGSMPSEPDAGGATVGAATRTAMLAEPGEVFVTEDTFRLSKGFFHFATAAEANVKENGSPIKIYRVIGGEAIKTRFDVSTERGLTALVGRKRELGLLLEAFDAAARGEGRAVSIVGEAGVGKSRLVYEFERAVSGRSVRILEGKCLPYGKNLAYHPITEMLRTQFGVEETDEDSVIRDKVLSALTGLGADEGFTLSYLLELLSVRNSGIDNILIGPEARKEGIIGAIKTLVLKASLVRPLVLVIEDLHWIDGSSKDLSRELLDILPGAAILLIFTYRPEFRHAWEQESVMTGIRLNRLTKTEGVEMISHLLGSEESDKALRRFVLDKAGGVPFFIEEYIRSLKHLKIMETKRGRLGPTDHDLRGLIPTTIQEVILARVDRLPEPSKRLLMKGAVVGREFNLRLMGRLTGIPEPDLRSRMRSLQKAGLLRQSGGGERPTFAFRHAMTHDAIYESILASTKKELHEEAARAIESLYKANLQDHYPVLTEHYFAGGNFERGAHFAKLSAQRARRTGSLVDAVAYARKRVTGLEAMSLDEETALDVAKARIVLGLILLEMNYLPEAKEAIEPIIGEVLNGNRMRMHSQILSILGIHGSWVEEDPEAGIELLSTALNRSKASGDVGSALHATHWLGISHAINCDFEEGARRHLDAINLAESIGRLARMSTLKTSLCGWCFFYSGKVTDGYRLSAEAIQDADDAGDIVAQSWAHVTRGMCCFGLGEVEEATDHLMRGNGLSGRANMFLCHSIAQHFLGEIRFEMEDYSKARDHYAKAVEIGERTRILPSWLNLNRLSLAASRAALGEKDIDLDFIRLCRKKNRVKLYDGVLARRVAATLLSLDERNLPEARKWVGYAVEADTRNGVRFYLAKDHEFSGQMLERAGNREKAREAYAKAIEIYRECGAERRAENAEKRLAALH